MKTERRLWWLAATVVLGGLWAAQPLWAQESIAIPAVESFGWLSDAIERHGVWWVLPVVFLGGLALNLTPCVYPMIPVTLAFFSNQASVHGRGTVLLAACYVLGISLTYAVLGMVAAQTGALFGAWLQQPAVLIGITAVVVALSLSMFGLYDLQLPWAVTRRFGRASAGLWGAFLMGAVVGFVAAPCIGPFVLGLLLVVANLASSSTGFLLFFVLGLGMGLPYLVLGIATHRVRHLPKAGPWLVWTKKVLGVALLGLALFLINSLLPERVIVLLTVALLAGSGAYLGWAASKGSRNRRFLMMRRAVGVVLIAAAVMIGWPRPDAASPVSWVPYSEAALESAQRAKQPILVDVYADWCLPCIEMDHGTFRKPEVVAALAPVATLRVDATRGVTEDAERFLQRHNVYGAPTILFFDRTGRERTEIRLTGFANTQEFLERLEQIL